MDVALLFLGTAGFAAYFFVQWLKARQTLERFESANTRFIEALQECAVAGEDPHEAMRAALHELYKDGYGVDVVDLYKAIKSGNVSAAPKRRYRKEQNDYPDAPMM